MKIFAVDKDQTGLLLSDKNTELAIKQYDNNTKTITVYMDKMAVQITMDEIRNLLLYAKWS